MKIVGVGKLPGELFREQYPDCGLSRSGRTHQKHNHDSIRGWLRPSEELVEQQVEVVHTVFPFHRVPPALVGRRTQAFLHVCAKRSEEHTSELQSRLHLVCRLLLEKQN